MSYGNQTAIIKGKQVAGAFPTFIYFFTFLSPSLGEISKYVGGDCGSQVKKKIWTHPNVVVGRKRNPWWWQWRRRRLTEYVLKKVEFYARIKHTRDFLLVFGPFSPKEFFSKRTFPKSPVRRIQKMLFRNRCSITLRCCKPNPVPLFFFYSRPFCFVPCATQKEIAGVQTRRHSAILWQSFGGFSLSLSLIFPSVFWHHGNSSCLSFSCSFFSTNAFYYTYSSTFLEHTQKKRCDVCVEHEAA